MIRQRLGQWEPLLALALILGVQGTSAAVAAMPYPHSWPIRTAVGCHSLPGWYQGLPYAVEDVGHRLSNFPLGALLQLPLGGTDEARRERDVRPVVLTVDATGRVTARRDENGSADARVGSCAPRLPAAALPSISLPESDAPNLAFSPLHRIGVRGVQPFLSWTAAGDLIVELRVTRRERRWETFGFPAVKRYWLWYRRVPDQ